MPKAQAKKLAKEAADDDTGSQLVEKLAEAGRAVEALEAMGPARFPAAPAALQEVRAMRQRFEAAAGWCPAARPGRPHLRALRCHQALR